MANGVGHPPRGPEQRLGTGAVAIEVGQQLEAEVEGDDADGAIGSYTLAIDYEDQ